MPNLQAIGAKTTAFWKACVTRTAPTRDKLHHQFNDHPEATGETYLQHLRFTIGMIGRLLLVSVVLLIHGMFPFLLVRTGSSQMENIWRILEKRKQYSAIKSTQSIAAPVADTVHVSE